MAGFLRSKQQEEITAANLKPGRAIQNNRLHIKNLDAIKGWAALIVCFAYSFAIAFYSLVYHYFYSSNYADWAMTHLSFLKADGHFWSVKVELCFYLILPSILLLQAFLKSKLLKLFTLSTLFGLTFYFFEIKKTLAITGGSGYVALYLAPFIMGIFLSVIRNYLPEKLYPIILHSGSFLIIYLCIDIPVFVNGFARSGMEFTSNLGWHYPILFYPIAGLLVLGGYKGSSLLLNSPFIKSLGRCGYSFYLWHILVVVLLSRFKFNEFIMFFAVAFITYLISIITFKFIELPFIDFAKMEPRQGL